MNQYSRLYQDLTFTAKELGFKVLHRRINGASINFDEGEIKIDSILKNTLLGCVLLGHELGHWVDFCNDKHSNFYWQTTDSSFPTITQKEIEDAEWSAVQFSKKIIKSRKISTKNIPDFDKKYFKKELVPLWIKAYNLKS